MDKDDYFQNQKDQVIYTLKQEIYALQCKVGNYDLLRKNMIELELKYRELLLAKA